MSAANTCGSSHCIWVNRPGPAVEQEQQDRVRGGRRGRGGVQCAAVDVDGEMVEIVELASWASQSKPSAWWAQLAQVGNAHALVPAGGVDLVDPPGGTKRFGQVAQRAPSAWGAPMTVRVGLPATTTPSPGGVCAGHVIECGEPPSYGGSPVTHVLRSQNPPDSRRPFAPAGHRAPHTRLPRPPSRRTRSRTRRLPQQSPPCDAPP
jgi:hypothetical protein